MLQLGGFVAVEGMDGSGKSTVTTMLAEEMRALGSTVTQTYEVGGTPVGKALRQLCFATGQEVVHPETRLLMVVAARIQHLRNVIRPALLDGHVVVTDRYDLSTLVYNAGLDGQAALYDMLWHRSGLDECLCADAYVYISVDPEKAFLRGKARGQLDNDQYKASLEQAKAIGALYEKEALKQVLERGGKVFELDGDQPLEVIEVHVRKLARVLMGQSSYTVSQSAYVMVAGIPDEPMV